MMNEVERKTLEAQPTLGASDVSKCLPGWITTFCEKFEAKEGYTLTHSAVSALCHTLIAARARAKRLVAERDKNKSAAEFTAWFEKYMARIKDESNGLSANQVKTIKLNLKKVKDQ
jgi:hypothetical protein